jgi:uncharacterized protein (TIGR00369 family)
VKPDAASEARSAFANIPFTRLLGVRREFSEGGRARMVLEPGTEFGNAVGAVHGGVVLTLLDVAMASAAVSQRDFECTAVTLNISSSFIEPGHGTLAADGEVLRHDRDIAFCRATVTDQGGRLVAHAIGSFRYIRRP